MKYVIEHGGWDPRPGWSEDDPTPEEAIRALAGMTRKNPEQEGFRP